MKIVIRITAAFFTLASTYLLTSFSRAVEPNDSVFGIMIFGFILSLVSQAGLIVSTTKFGQNNRVVAVILMAPMTLILLASSFDALTRLLAGNPPLFVAIVSFWVGLFVYIYAFHLLFRARATT